LRSLALKENAVRTRLLTLAIAWALASPLALAQQAPAPEPGPEGATVPLTYVGTDTRISLGIDDDADVLGEALRVFGNDGDSSWVAEGWLGQGGEGGLKLDYHWLWGGKTRQDTIDNPDTVTVAKVFGAIDQNVYDDRKATLGFGVEREHLFLDVYGSAALTGKRLADTFVDVDNSIITGTDNGRPFQQTQTITTTTRAFEHPYDWGVGARVGRFFDSHLARVRAGLDYESGDFESDQFTVSFGIDKYIANSGHSISLELESYSRDGDFERDRDDRRAWLLWRYELGQSFRPAEPYRMVETTREVAPAHTPEPVVIRNEVRVQTDSFFVIDRAELTEVARAALADVVAVMKSDKRVSRISITGHTCDLGSEAYNQRLSERRAEAARAYFAEQGVTVDEIDISGAGELDPKFPNDGEDNRKKNRRVDVSFLTIDEHVQTPAATPAETKVEWVREPVKVPAAWIERALRNPAEHKRTVDVYRFEEVEQTTELGPRQFLNRGPNAVNDTGTMERGVVSIIVPVLANDTDPDSDQLRVTSITQPTNGTAEILVTGVRYAPRADFVGTDTFTYTISDGNGGTATATVTVTVTPPSNRAPIAVDDAKTMILYDFFTVIDLLGNDSDPDGDAITLLSTSTPANGRVEIIGNGNVIYRPNAGFCGVDTFTYMIRDARGATATATVRVTVLD
jgi:outer membrane protein OmpA-like peptidoglycan-associated protein